MAFWPFSPRGKRASRNAQEREQKENSTTRTTVESGPKKALLKRKNKHGTGAAAKSSDAGVRRPDIRGNDTSDVQAPAATAVNAAGVESTNPPSTIHAFQ
ncbi:hypothetical protein KEM55_005418 [Ascosphaera atra]|nr:hypothetical protein KEM55_005418 [Ascosphaera atra]